MPGVEVKPKAHAMQSLSLWNLSKLENSACAPLQRFSVHLYTNSLTGNTLDI